MSLRLKSILLTTVVTAGLIAALYLVFSINLRQQFSLLERQTVEEETRRAVNILLGELENLDAMAEDWAPWDDTYEFIEDRNEEYIQRNLTDEVFANFRLNLMLFVHASGRVVYGKAFDLEKGEEVPVPAAAYALASDEQIIRHTNTRQGRTGILLLPEGPLLFSSWPIVTSLYQGPIRGALVMGRYLTPAEVQRLSELLDRPLAVYPVNRPAEMPGDVRMAFALLQGDASILVRPMSSETIAGYALLRDIRQEPALILEVRLPRTVYWQGQRAIRYNLVSLVIIGTLFGILSFLLLERFAVSRMLRMSAEVDAIGVSGDPSRRIRVQGRDELSRLQIAINRMLEAIESAQQARAESEVRYRMVMEQTSEGIALVDGATKRFIDANAAFQKLVGYPLEELCQRTLPEIEDEAERDIQQVVEEGTPLLGERTFWRRDGSSVMVEVTMNRIFHQGRPILCLLARDITQRKQMERYLIRTERMAAMGQLAAALAHEINNPLHSIGALLELVMDFPLDEAERRDHLRAMQREVQRLMRLTRQILEFSRPSSRERTPVNLRETLRHALHLADRQLREHGIQVNLSVPDNLPPVVGSQDQLAQVFLNVILNAVDSMPDGGRLDISVTPGHQQIVLTFADTGPGIPPDVMEHLFEPFITTKKGGTGLGLAISQNIIRQHGGIIAATNAPEGGAVFTITLPTGL